MATKKSLPVVYAPEDVSPENQNAYTKGPPCNGCDLKHKKRIPGQGPAAVDIMFVSENPSWFSACNGKMFSGRGGTIIKSTVKQIVDADTKMGSPLGLSKLTRFETYAVQCECEKEGITKNTLEHCSQYLHAAITSRKPKIIVAFGANALKACNIKTAKFTDSRGKLLTTTIGQDNFIVLPTFSSKAMLAKAGVFNLFKADLIRAFKIASGAEKALMETDINELTKDYKIPKTVEEVRDLCREIINYTGTVGGDPSKWAIALDTETNTLHPHRLDARVICLSVAWDNGKAAAFPLWHKDSTYDVNDVLPYVRELLECNKPKVFHNSKFDLKFLELRHGLSVNNVKWCTLIGEHYLNENQSGSYSLKTLGRTFFPEYSYYADKIHDLAESETKKAVKETLTPSSKRRKSSAKGMEEMPTFEMSASAVSKELGIGSKKKQKNSNQDSGYENVPIADLLLYAAIDTDLTRKLLRHQFKRIDDEGSVKIKSMMQALSLPAARVLGKMEFGGFKVDREYVRDLMEDKLHKVLTSTESEIRKHWDGGPSGEKAFMLNSPADIGYMLFNKGVLIDSDGSTIDPRNRRTFLIPGVVELNEKSGQWKTNKATLRALAEKADCGFAKSVLDYRAAFKAKSTFLSEIMNLSELDGRVHSNFNLHGTATGRLSSNSINMQNIPSGLANVNIKKLFIPDDPENELILNLDYKGAEVRIFTAYANDKNLIDAINNGMDAHCFFASKIYNESYDDLQAVNLGSYVGDPVRRKKLKQMRTNIKRIVFGILYGAGANKIAAEAGISKEKALETIESLFDMFPAVREYVEGTKKQIDKDFYVETLMGRRRRFPLTPVSSFFRSSAHRQGVNMKIQGLSSDIVLGRLVELNDHMREVGGRLVITVHDSIVATVNKKYVGQLPDFLQYYCADRVREICPWLPVAFKYDAEVGPNYGETVPLAKYINDNGIVKEKTEEELREATFEEEVITALKETDEEEEQRKRDEEKDFTSSRGNQEGSV